MPRFALHGEWLQRGLSIPQATAHVPRVTHLPALFSQRSGEPRYPAIPSHSKLLEKFSLENVFSLALRTDVSYNSVMSITDRQEELLKFIADFKRQRLSSPSLEEMCKALGVTSRGSLLKHVRALAEQGYLAPASGKKRDWNLTPRAWNLVGRPVAPSIPLVGHIAAGTPILAEENREDELPVDPALFGSGEAFALRIRGDSMIEAHIQDGDLAIIRPQGEAQNGQIVAVQVDGLEVEATLKIFRKVRQRVELHPANSRYVPLVYEGDERSKVRVLGKLIGIIRPSFQ